MKSLQSIFEEITTILEEEVESRHTVTEIRKLNHLLFWVKQLAPKLESNQEDPI